MVLSAWHYDQILNLLAKIFYRIGSGYYAKASTVSKSFIELVENFTKSHGLFALIKVFDKNVQELEP
jgi:hypothetical protein